MNDFFNWLITLYNDDKVAFVSLCLTLVFGFFSWLAQLKRNKQDDIRQAEQDEFNRLAQDELKEFQSFQKKFAEYQQKVSELQFNFESQENFKPYFEFSKTKSSTYVEGGKLIARICLTNVGRGTATKIMTNPIDSDQDGNPMYFRTIPTKQTHAIYDYFSETFAIPNDSIFLSTTALEQTENQNHCIEFKVKFCDSSGRTYEQKFEFGYDNFLVRGINLKSVTYEPTLIK
ncbi:TPA: hypothetical protein ACJSD2_000033 [Streptococcus agalactiae]